MLSKFTPLSAFLVFFLVTFITIVAIYHFKKEKILLSLKRATESDTKIDTRTLSIGIYYLTTLVSIFLAVKFDSEHQVSIWSDSGILLTIYLGVILFCSYLIAYVIIRAICYSFFENRFYKLTDDELNNIYKISLLYYALYFSIGGLFYNYSICCIALYLSSLFWMKISLEEILKKIYSLKDISPIFLLFSSIVLIIGIADAIFEEYGAPYCDKAAYLGVLLAFAIHAKLFISKIKSQLSKEKEG